MAKYEIQAPNGDLYEIEGPEDATDEQLAEVVAQILTPGVSTDPTEGMGRWDRFAAGFGKAYSDLGRGVQQASLAAAEYNPGVRIADLAERAVGGEGALARVRERSAQLSADEAEARATSRLWEPVLAALATSAAKRLRSSLPALDLPPPAPALRLRFFQPPFAALQPKAQFLARHSLSSMAAQSERRMWPLALVPARLVRGL